MGKGEKETEVKDKKGKNLTSVEKLLQDNQISRAVDLIRGINLFSNNIKSTSMASANKHTIRKTTNSASN